MQPIGPDPRRVQDLESLAVELELLRKRAAVGRGSQMVSYSILTSMLGLPATTKSTIYDYMKGNSLAPPDVLDEIVVALGATSDEQAEWRNAWFRADSGRAPSLSKGKAMLHSSSGSVLDTLALRLNQSTLRRRFDVLTSTAHNLDLIHQVDEIAPDHEAEVASPRVAPGGSGANTSVALSLLGLRTSTIGAVADDWRGEALRQSLEAAGVETSLLLTVSGGDSGNTLVFTDGEGRRLIYVHPGANALLSKEVQRRELSTSLAEQVRGSRWLHLSSFTSTAERLMQEEIVSALDEDQILSLTPGSIYSALGADRIAPLLRRANLLFAYEHQFDTLLERSSVDTSSGASNLSDKLGWFFSWRASRGSVEPMLVVIKRPAGIVRGELRDYLMVGAGRATLEEIGGPDTGSSRREIVDATGAGDALAAGTIAGILRGLNLSECCNLAFLMALCASSGVGARGSLPTKEQIVGRWSHYLPDVPVPGGLALE